MFENLVEVLKANPRKIVFTEGPDARILEAAARLKKEGFLTPILIGNMDEVKAAAAKGCFDIVQTLAETVFVIKCDRIGEISGYVFNAFFFHKVTIGGYKAGITVIFG